MPLPLMDGPGPPSAAPSAPSLCDFDSIVSTFYRLAFNEYKPAYQERALDNFCRVDILVTKRRTGNFVVGLRVFFKRNVQVLGTDHWDV